MFCSQCGTQASVADRFCRACGDRIESPPAHSPRRAHAYISMSNSSADAAVQPAEVSASSQPPVPSEVRAEATLANRPAQFWRKQLPLGIFTLVLAIGAGMIASQVMLGRSRSAFPLIQALWVPCLAAICSPAPASRRVIAALAGLCVGGFAWIAGHGVIAVTFALEHGTSGDAPFTVIMASIPSAAFIVSGVTAHRLCRTGDFSEPFTWRPFTRLAGASVVGLAIVVLLISIGFS